MIMRMLISTAIIGLIASCKSTQQVVQVDEHQRHIDVFSSYDGKSAMLNKAQDRRFNNAVSDLERRVNQNPQNTDNLLNLAQLYLVQDRHDDAEVTARRVLRLDIKNNDARRILAQVAIRRGNPEMASIILSSMDEEALNDSQTLNLRAMVALAEQKPEQAMALFREALRVNPSDVAVRMNLGVLLLQYRQLDAAAVQFERILNGMPDHIDAKMHLAVIKAVRGENRDAERIYRQVLSQQRDHPLALFNLAVVQKRQQRYDRALDSLKGYLQTSYARTVETDGVFALIERIQTEKAARGERVSDAEIQRLAQEVRSEPRPQQTARTVGPATSEVAPIESRQRGQRVDEILELERQLMQ